MNNKKKQEAPQLRKGILREKSKISSPTRKVGFVDNIGKPLAEYRYLPPEDEFVQSSDSRYEKTSGHFISTHRDNQLEPTSWNVIPVKNAVLPKSSSEMRLIEEKRLDDNNIFRFTFDGDFDVFEPPHLIEDAMNRARAPVPIIPIAYIPPQQPIQLIQPYPLHNYQEVPEKMDNQINQNSLKVPQTNDSVFNLMAKLKQRGLITATAEQLELSSDNTNPMTQSIQRRTWTQSSKRANRMCKYYINNPNGCNRGDLCKFEHNDEERERRQKDNQKKDSRNESWRPRQSRMSSGDPENRKRGFRSRSP